MSASPGRSFGAAVLGATIGALLYESLVGETPFDGNTHFEIMTRHLNDPPQPPSVRGDVRLLRREAMVRRRLPSAAMAERVLAPLRALATPIADVVSPIPYPDIYKFTAFAAASGTLILMIISVFGAMLPPALDCRPNHHCRCVENDDDDQPADCYERQGFDDVDGEDGGRPREPLPLKEPLAEAPPRRPVLW